MTLKRNPSLLGIPPSKPTPKDSVLVIVDAQNEYDHGLLAIADVKASRAVIGDVLGRYREVGGDVVSKQVYQNLKVLEVSAIKYPNASS